MFSARPLLRRNLYGDELLAPFCDMYTILETSADRAAARITPVASVLLAS
jgi:hypothetical protein